MLLTLNSRISSTGKGKPAANLGLTLPWTLCPPGSCAHLVCGGEDLVFEMANYNPFRVFLTFSVHPNDVGCSCRVARMLLRMRKGIPALPFFSLLF